MASTEQINANQQNAQLSTGPTSPEGKARSSQNATRHGFTGLTLVVTPAEKEAYEAFVATYHDHYNPPNLQQAQLVQQLADLDWSIHQISVQQHNTISMMNAATAQPGESFDPAATAALFQQFTRVLTSLSTYEGRRRRAAAEVRAELEALKAAYDKLYAEQLPKCAKIFQLYKAKGQTWDPIENGFVCSVKAIERYLLVQQRAQEGNR